MIATLQGRSGLSGVLGSSEFFLPAYDAGAGAVNTTLTRGVGSPTFARATVAWTKLSSGLWAQVGSGVARSSYIGLTTAVGAYGGYFAEGAGTQLVTPTASIRDMTQVEWVKVTMTTAFTSTGIGGVASSCTRLTAAGVNSTILQTLVAAASSRTYSCWMKRVTGTGTILIRQGATTLDVTALINSATFTLVQLPASVLNSAFGIQINTDTDAIDVDFNQFEAGAFATSPMDAAGAVRNADVLTYPVTGNMDSTVGSAYAEITPNVGGVVGNLRILVTDGDGASPILLSSGQPRVFDGTTFDSSGLAAITVDAMTKVASNWGGVTMMAFASGVAGGSQAFDGTMTATLMEIGSRNGGLESFSGAIKNIRIWQRQLSNSVLQSITA